MQICIIKIEKYASIQVHYMYNKCVPNKKTLLFLNISYTKFIFKYRFIQSDYLRNEINTNLKKITFCIYQKVFKILIKKKRQSIKNEFKKIKITIILALIVGPCTKLKIYNS